MVLRPPATVPIGILKMNYINQHHWPIESETLVVEEFQLEYHFQMSENGDTSVSFVHVDK